MDTYRVFISYSHHDLDLVLQIVKVLEEHGLIPMWDKNFAYGHGFHEQIKTFIAHAHVFLPCITPHSSQQGWVHQEIGYAMALHVPILPVTLGITPGEMLQQLHAVQLSESLQELPQQLSVAVFEHLVQRHQDPSQALYQCAELTEDRAILLATYARNVLELGYTGCVRQKGGLSSFHIPRQLITDVVWKQRYGTVPQNLYHCRLLREERLALEQHARHSGCRLIIDPSLPCEPYGPQARRVRLATLVTFLESMPDGKAQVALSPEKARWESVTLVGDWFAAESVAGVVGHGYQQTIFSRHAPSLWSKIVRFEQEFAELLRQNGWSAATSRTAAIDALKALIAEI
jgi:hypothetical protein